MPAVNVSIVVKEREEPITLPEKLSLGTAPFCEIPTPNGAQAGAVIEIEKLIT
ncbi:Uncharacterized protein BC88300_02898 [Bacillus cytotoxicus]|uniref:Uncharacterized protein n=1 Tax=Bacillus cytotoxicus TaxID=580165 RepID=A0AAX2CIH1_9BACI|nr:Uncharacterized protein BCB44BAC_02716 [Bacillus cytotoxicus]SCN39259.1 Uncharacterized protein BC88300_02898 [Bacillus cytotoxicus]